MEIKVNQDITLREGFIIIKGTVASGKTTLACAIDRKAKQANIQVKHFEHPIAIHPNIKCDHDNLIQALDDLKKEIDNRLSLLEELQVRTYKDLTDESLMKPLAVIIDNYDQLIELNYKLEDHLLQVVSNCHTVNICLILFTTIGLSSSRYRARMTQALTIGFDACEDETSQYSLFGERTISFKELVKLNFGPYDGIFLDKWSLSSKLRIVHTDAVD